VGAGSTITADVPAGHLGIGRGKQRNIPGWRRPPKKDDH
jgi:bifunctional UDP-N-acetylglucosamine pyrophosphorylase/glucosamine-1-phosphate N-acetyltransferase